MRLQVICSDLFDVCLQCVLHSTCSAQGNHPLAIQRAASVVLQSTLITWRNAALPPPTSGCRKNLPASTSGCLGQIRLFLYKVLQSTLKGCRCSCRKNLPASTSGCRDQIRLFLYKVLQSTLKECRRSYATRTGHKQGEDRVLRARAATYHQCTFSSSEQRGVCAWRRR